MAAIRWGFCCARHFPTMQWHFCCSDWYPIATRLMSWRSERSAMRSRRSRSVIKSSFSFSDDDSASELCPTSTGPFKRSFWARNTLKNLFGTPMSISITELASLLTGVREYPEDLGRWLVASDALREADMDRLADCFALVGAGADASVRSVICSAAEIKGRIAKCLAVSNGMRTARILSDYSVIESLQVRMDQGSAALIDINGGQAGWGFYGPVTTAVSGGLIPLLEEFWLAVLYVRCSPAWSRKAALANQGPNRGSRAYRERDAIGFVLRCLRESSTQSF